MSEDRTTAGWDVTTGKPLEDLGLTRRRIVQLTGAAALAGGLSSGTAGAAGHIDPVPEVEWGCSSASVDNWEEYDHIVAVFIDCDGAVPGDNRSDRLTDGEIDWPRSNGFYLHRLAFFRGGTNLGVVFNPLDRDLCCRLISIAEGLDIRTPTPVDFGPQFDALGTAFGRRFDALVFEGCDPDEVNEAREKCEEEIAKAREKCEEERAKAQEKCQKEAEKAREKCLEELAKAEEKVQKAADECEKHGAGSEKCQKAIEKAEEAVAKAEEECLEELREAQEKCLEALHEAEEECLEELHEAHEKCLEELHEAERECL